MTNSKRLTVYEVINERRQEIFVGTTPLPIFALVQLLAKRRPAAIRHWDLSEATSVRSVEFDLKPDEAKAFVENYMRSKLPRGWAYVSDAEPPKSGARA